MIFCFSVEFVVISPPSFLILFRASLLPSWWAWIKVYQFYLFKTPPVGFIDLSYCFCTLYFFISSQITIISFLLLTLGFAHSSFPNSCRWQVKWSEVLVSWGRPVSLWIALLALLLLCPVDFSSVVTPFSFVSRYFLIFSLISSLTHFF